MFVPYLRNEHAGILRTYQYRKPAKQRGGTNELKFEDLRAIPFVSSWSQLKQNVPGFFGFGFALNELKNQGRFAEVKTLYHKDQISLKQC